MTGEEWADRPPWLVQVRRSRTQPAVGTGVLVTPDHVLTCAHVVAPDGRSQPRGRIWVRLQHTDVTHDPVATEVIAWSPEDQFDVAVLRLLDPLPAPAAPAPLVSATSVVGHPVGACGFPRGHQDDGATWRGVVTGAGVDHLELRADDGLGFELESGFSGGPLWDRELGGLIGIVMGRARARKPDDAVPAASPRVGYAMHTDAVRRVWPALPEGYGLTFARMGELVETYLESDRLPLVGEVDLEVFGVHPINEFYVLRPAIDEPLRERVRAGRFVLAVGKFVAGKSRSLAEAVRSAAADRSLIVPVDGPAVSRLASAGSLPVAPAGAVLWLDDLDRFVMPGGLDEQVLNRLVAHRPPIIVAATMPSRRYMSFIRGVGTGASAGSPIDHLARASVRRLLDRAAPAVDVPERLVGYELEAAVEAYPGFVPADGRLGHHLRSVRVVREMLLHGRGDSPAGWAVLMAAIDWRRTGVGTPIPGPVLRELLPHYLDEPIGEGEFADAVLWATGAPGEPGAIVSADGGRSFRPESYLAELVETDDSTPAGPIPEAVWRSVIESADSTPADLMAVSYLASGHGLPEISIAAAEAVARRTVSPWFSAWSQLVRGQLEALRDNVDEAKSLLRGAVESGIADLVEMAQVELAVILINANDPEAAAPLLTSALNSTDADIRKLAKTNMGILRSIEGDQAAAAALLEEVARSDDVAASPTARAHLGALLALSAGAARAAKPDHEPEVGDVRLVRTVREFGGLRATSIAQAQLGLIRMGQGDPERAREMLESALASGDPMVLPMAQAGMGHLLLGAGDVEGAAGLFAEAMAAGQPHPAALAAIGAAGVAYQRGDAPEAMRVLDDLVGLDHPEFSPMAADLLGDLRAEVGDPEGAEHAYRLAIRSGHRDWSQMARIDLAMLLEGTDSGTAARDLLEQVVRGGHRMQAPRAADLLGDLLRRAGDPSAAATAYRESIDLNHPDWSLIARNDLAELLKEQDGDPDQVLSLLATVAGSAHVSEAPRADYLTADVLDDLGDLAGAREAFGRATASGHPYWSMAGRIGLGMVAAKSNDLAEAESSFTEATEAESPLLVGTALLVRALVRIERDDRPGARTDLMAAVELDDQPSVAAQAAFHLVTLSIAEGSITAADDWARVMSGHLTRWSGDPHPWVVETPPDAAAGRPLLGLVDHLWRVGPEADRGLLSSLEALPADLFGESERRALRIRVARRWVLDGRTREAEAVLREAIKAGDDMQWCDEAVARVYLSVLLTMTRPDRDRHRLDEATELLRPFTQRDDASVGPFALYHLARLEELHSRLQREAGQQAAGQAHLDRATELLRLAADAGDRHGDGDTGRQARATLSGLLEEPGTAAPTFDDNSEHPDRSPRTSAEVAQLDLLRRLGELASAEGATDEALQWFHLAGSADQRTVIATAVAHLEAGATATALACLASLSDESLSKDLASLRDAARVDVFLLNDKWVPS